MLRARPLLWAATAAYAAGFGSLSILRHRAFATGRFDLGNMTQTVWSTAHGHGFELTSLQGEQVSRLAAHTDVVLVLFAPLWWLWPSPELLLTAQALLVAVGAVPVFAIARKHLGSERTALGFSLAYLLYPATEWLTLNEFHPVALATPFLLYAFRHLDDDRIVRFAVFALLAIACKEEIGLAVAGLGLWYALARRRYLPGAAVVVAGGLVTAIAVLVVIPAFNPGGSQFASRYDDMLGEVFEGDTFRYLLHLGAPVGFLFVLAPVVLLAALPDFLLNILSSTETQTSIHFHYTAGIVAPVIIAAVLGARRLPRSVPVAALVVAATLIANWKLGAIPLWGYVPGGEDYQRSAATITHHDRIAARALRTIPGDAPVSATNSLGAHLSERRVVLSFPKLAEATWVAVDETRPSYADRLAPIPAAAALARLRRNPGWMLVFQEDGIAVFRRRSTNSATRSRLRASSDHTSSPSAHSPGYSKYHDCASARHATRSTAAASDPASGTSGISQTRYCGESTFPNASAPATVAATAGPSARRRR